MEKKINYVKMPVPSSPGPAQITNIDLKYQKGGSEMSSPMPKKNVIPDGVKGGKSKP